MICLYITSCIVNILKEKNKNTLDKIHMLFHMSCKIILLITPVITEWTSIWSFSSMSPNMLLKVILSTTPVITIWTSKGSFSSVNSYVFRHIIFLCKLQITIWTGKWLFWRMYHNMGLQTGNLVTWIRTKWIEMKW